MVLLVHTRNWTFVVYVAGMEQAAQKLKVYISSRLNLLQLVSSGKSNGALVHHRVA